MRRLENAWDTRRLLVVRNGEAFETKNEFGQWPGHRQARLWLIGNRRSGLANMVEPS
jgi:hypothetical protein